MRTRLKLNKIALSNEGSLEHILDPLMQHSDSTLINIGIDCIRMSPSQMADTEMLSKKTVKAIRKYKGIHNAEIALTSIAGFITNNNDIDELKKHIETVIKEIEKVEFNGNN